MDAQTQQTTIKKPSKTAPPSGAPREAHQRAVTPKPSPLCPSRADIKAGKGNYTRALVMANMD